jgi:hypothetical protein
MLVALWGALGAAAVLLAVVATFCQFGAILVVRPSPSISLKACGVALGIAATGLALSLISRHAAWYFATLASSSTGFAALYLLALVGSFPEFERRHMSIVMVSMSVWALWAGATALLWFSAAPGIADAAEFWIRIAEWPFRQ